MTRQQLTESYERQAVRNCRCPRCGMPAGHQCVTWDGRVSRAHRARVDALVVPHDGQLRLDPRTFPRD